jgi:hypothetical protein
MTNSSAPKPEWIKPELVRLGKMTDVAGQPSAGTQAPQSHS